jgi:hypothetical protein
MTRSIGRGPRLLSVLLLRLLTGALVLAAVWFSRPVRGALVALEPATPTILFLLPFAVTLSRLARRDGATPLWERALGRVLARWGWVPAILLCWVPLWSHWAGAPPSPTTAFAALMGYVPWADAHGHLEGALRLLGDGAFGSYSERRPINAALLAVRLVLGGGRLPAALALQATVLGIAAFLFARSVGLRHGLWSALGSFALVLGLVRGYVPTTDTEPLGVTLACLGLCVLGSAGVRSRPWLLALGVFVFAIALDARPGAQLLLPAFIVWGIVLYRGRRSTVAIMLVAAALASAGLTRTLNATYGAGEGSFTAYPAFTFYGLTRNANYRQAYMDFGAEIAQARGEGEVARLLYRKGLENLRERPSDFIAALVGNEGRFFGKLAANLTGVVSPRLLFASDLDDGARSVDERVANLRAGLLLLALCVLGAVLFLVRSALPTERWFWLASALGFFGSIPFVYGDGGFRVLACGFPLLALFLSLAFSTARPTRAREHARSCVEAPTLSTALGLAIGLVVVALVGPALLRNVWPRPTAAQVAAAKSGETLLVALESSPAVLVSRVPRTGLLEVPWISEVGFMRQMALAEIKDEPALTERKLPFVLLSAYDFVAQRQRLMLAPVEILREREGFLNLKATPIAGSRLLEVDAWTALGGSAQNVSQ